MDKKETDLERFVALYKSFGIECKINHIPEMDISDVVDFHIPEHYEIILGDNYDPIREATESEKFDGYDGFFTDIHFDMEGNFIQQGFWE